MPEVKVIRPVGRPTITSQALNAWAVEVGNWVIGWMEDPPGSKHGARIATGVSINSLVVQTTRNPETITLFGNEGVAWALQGRKAGAWPNVDAIKEWIVNKPLRLRPDPNTGKIPTLDQATFLIGRKIANEGTDLPRLRPQNLQLVIQQLGRKHLEVLGDELARNMSEAIRDAWTIREPKKDMFPSTKLFGIRR